MDLVWSMTKQRIYCKSHRLVKVEELKLFNMTYHKEHQATHSHCYHYHRPQQLHRHHVPSAHEQPGHPCAWKASSKMTTRECKHTDVGLLKEQHTMILNLRRHIYFKLASNWNIWSWTLIVQRVLRKWLSRADLMPCVHLNKEISSWIRRRWDIHEFNPWYKDDTSFESNFGSACYDAFTYWFDSRYSEFSRTLYRESSVSIMRGCDVLRSPEFDELWWTGTVVQRQPVTSIVDGSSTRKTLPYTAYMYQNFTCLATDTVSCQKYWPNLVTQSLHNHSNDIRLKFINNVQRITSY